MKFLVIYILFLIYPLALLSQKETKLSFSSTDKKIIFPAAYKQLTKEDKYKIIYPSKLTYIFGEDQVRTELTGTNSYAPIPIKAKQHLATPDYLFEIKMTGITNMQVAPNRWHRDEVGGPRGFVKDISYNFPCELIVRNSSGDVLKQIAVVPGDKLANNTEP